MKFQPSKEEWKLIPEIFGNTGNSFLQHLELSDNDRILFSGMFGIGKTTFLNHFFNQSEILNKYNVFHLYPVNYSILSNGDIFKYIKYDILYNMLERKMLQNKSNLDFLAAEPSFVRKNLVNITSLLLLLIPKMGKQLYQLKEEIQNLHRVFLEFKITDEEENEAINKLINSYTKSDGELYEFNTVTKIIHSKLSSLKQENILIIDDLDRIDPKHIFRLFNVFAAHFDTKNDDKNKFGFDKIIFVCDVKNIRNIYKHVYGIHTDFNGYIDKFYSREVFHFDNVVNIKNILKQIFNQTTFLGDTPQHTEWLNKNHFLIETLVLIFSNLLIAGEINLRNILKNYKKEINLKQRLISLENTGGITDRRFRFFQLIRIVSSYFVDSDSLKSSVEKSIHSFSHYLFDEIYSLGFLYGELIHAIKIVDNSAHKTSSSNWNYKLENYIFSCEDKNLNEKLNIISSSVINVRKVQEGLGSRDININALNYFEFLLKAIEKIEKIGYLK